MFIYYLLIFSKHGHLITSYRSKDVELDNEEELLSGFFSAIQMGYRYEYNNPIQSIRTKNCRLYFLNDEINSIIYLVACNMLTHLDGQNLLKNIRDRIDDRFHIDGDKPCYFPFEIYSELDEILSKEVQTIENHVMEKYFSGENQEKKAEDSFVIL